MILLYLCYFQAKEAEKRFISWNVNGLRAAVGKGFLEYFKEADADIFSLQETKLQAGQIDLETEGYHQYWNYAEKKGYSGVAVFTKQEPLSVAYGIGVEEHDHEGRVITLEFSRILLCDGIYPQFAAGKRPSGVPHGMGGCVPPRM